MIKAFDYLVRRNRRYKANNDSTTTIGNAMVFLSDAMELKYQVSQEINRLVKNHRLQISEQVIEVMKPPKD